ncbi:MAG: type III-D CRISPR-associated protein Csx19 [Stellaceae bacterium]
MVSLNTALTRCVGVLGDAVALLYTPEQCRFARIDDAGMLVDETAQPLAADLVFEARVFSRSAELRWLRQGEHQGVPVGRAALIGEHQNAPPAAMSPVHPPWPEIIGTLGQRYLLWGMISGNTASPGWSTLFSRRIGQYAVPVAGGRDGSRVALLAREYLGERAHGNVVVVGERLVRLEVLDG